MRRFFIEEIDQKDGLCVIPEKEAKHMIKVLRMKQGDSFILMDEKGNHFESVIEDISRYEVSARIVKALPKPSISPVTINICQAVLKPRMMDYMVEKTSELGVSSIMPFYSERTVIKLDDSKAVNKTRHWKEIARSASKQSGRIAPAEISGPVQFNDLIKSASKTEGLKVVLWEGEDITYLKKLIRSENPSSNFTGIIGPEGGFAKKEIEQLKDAGIVPVSLGSRILRAETAAIALTTIIQYEWGDLGFL
ncbi:MAG: 16S rRNA (uracil(1498)-N(3))-methyltransferase [Desulfobacteraceae bacterium]